jgi:hypothetical protein
LVLDLDGTECVVRGFIRLLWDKPLVGIDCDVNGCGLGIAQSASSASSVSSACWPLCSGWGNKVGVCRRIVE